MKILHIIPNLSKGGAERLVLDIVRELNKRNQVEVRLVIFRNEIAYDIKDISHLVHIIPASVQLSTWHQNRYQIDELQKFMEDFHPNIIHSHLFEAEIVSRSCTYINANWFTHGHDAMQQLKKFKIQNIFSKKKITEFFEREFLMKRYKLNGATTFVTISNHIKIFFKQNIPNKEHILLLNAIDYDKFKNEIFRKGCSTPIKLINVGSFVQKKNQQFLIVIAEMLRKQNIDFEVHFLGDGQLKSHIEQFAKEKGLLKNINFHGNVNEVEKYLAKSDIYIHTASHEPLGLVLLEAMAAGLPVITLDGGGNRDLMEEGKNGFLIEEENVELFVEKILELKNNPALYQNMSQYAKTYAQKFDIVPYVDNLLKLYKKASSCAE
jgi:glycosyltransferase involved in cell wall biosynthesis